MPHLHDRWQLAIRRFFLRLGISVFDPSPLNNHATAREIADHLGKTRFSRYSSFAIVRNPWDWQVSLYRYMLLKKDHPQHLMTKGFGGFEAYIRWRCQNEARFQTEFILDRSGKLLIDYLGRFENLSQDFSKICSQLGCSASLPRLNVSRNDSYRDYYTRETQDLVRRCFDKDIGYLGYEF